MELVNGRLRDVFPMVLLFVPSKDVLRSRLVSKSWQAKIDSLQDSFWKEFFLVELWRDWISASSYFCLSLEEFDLFASPIPAIAIPALQKLTPYQRIKYMQRGPIFTRPAVRLSFFRDELTRSFKSEWLFVRAASGLLEWRGEDEETYTLTVEQEAQLEKSLFGLQHNFKAPFTSTWQITVTITDDTTKSVILVNKHTFGHFLDEIVGQSMDDKQKFLTDLVNMEKHCRETFIKDAIIPEYLK